MEPSAFRSIAGLLSLSLIPTLFSTEILYFIICHPERCFKGRGAPALCLLLAPPPFCKYTFLLLLPSQISVAIAHVSDDTSQIHNDEIILSTVQSVYACHIDLHALLINEVLR